MRIAMYMLTILYTWLILSCGKKDSLPPYVPPPAPIDTLANVTQYGTPFSNVTDRQDAVIYQVNIRTFSQQGNFAGVMERLDSIKALGANVVYLMPIYPVGIERGINSPYAVRNYAAVNSEFGTMQDLRNLVAAAHSKNISVILDWVANHTAWDNAWIKSHKDWYLQDGNGNVVSPPGMGWNDVAQLNYANTDLRKAMIKSMKYWVLAANIDGFRCDYADGPPVEFWKQAIDTLRAIPNRKLLLLAEGGRTANYSAGFDYNFGFGFFNNLKSVYGTNQPVQSIDNLNVSDYANASNGQQVVRYISNHDVNGGEGTPLELFGGKEGSMAAFVVVSFMKSVPMIYNGQEVATPIRLTFPFTSTKIDWSINPDVTAEYKKVIAIRNNSVAIRRGSLTSYSTADVCAFVKEVPNEKVLVLSNLRNQAVSYSIPAALLGTQWTDAISGESIAIGSTFNLSAYNYRVLKQQ